MCFEHRNPHDIKCKTYEHIAQELFKSRPPLWSSCQSSWMQIQRSLVRFPALPDFLRSSWSGTGSTQPREYEELLEWKSSGSGSRKPRLTAVGIRCADHMTPPILKSWH
jgi:hypothetical protein